MVASRLRRFLAPSGGQGQATTTLAQGGQDIADGIQWMDALERAASHELEAPVRRAGSPERQQSHRAMRRVWSLAADRTQVAAPLSRAGASRSRRAEPTSGLDSRQAPVRTWSSRSWSSAISIRAGALTRSREFWSRDSVPSLLARVRSRALWDASAK